MAPACPPPTICAGICRFLPESIDLTQPLQGERAAPYVTYYEDTTRQLGFEALLKRQDRGNTVALTHGYSNRGMSSSALWMEFSASNPTDQLKSWLVEATYSHIDFIDVYLVAEDETVEHLKLGDRRPFSNRPIAAETFVIPIDTPAHSSSRVLIRMAYQDIGLLDSNLQLWSPEVTPPTLSRTD
ncbi:7TM-DISM domain-containing protein [Candidatus Reidiella endopervernicosa]|uniref:7TM-DISM receptor extracellular domain-containing protein n=1 Tax=Candidatus Reidiella endopervernicosa TaxID=2738883 RepID=A0A6N0HYF2_9GAMM|nr:7TM-DISM domain-containing protein [Candidatus Reidiella endopervernicosa]QKQ27373.1 hypothetical protein HUE57_14610 [Candidatus Reidiella endopervernicosa]